MNTDTTDITTADLEKAYAGSYYTILGAGGPLEDWVTHMTKLMQDQGIGTPTGWVKTTGERVNEYAQPKRSRDFFPSDLVVLMFPLDGLITGKLAMFKLQMQDRWFDDIVDNMSR